MNCAVCEIPIEEFPPEYTDRMGSHISPKYYRKEEELIIFCSPHCGTEWLKKHNENSSDV